MKFSRGLAVFCIAFTAVTAPVLGFQQVREAMDPRQPDAYERPVFNECVGTTKVFIYELHDGSNESLIMEDAAQCGGDPGDGSAWGEDTMASLDDEGKILKVYR